MDVPLANEMVASQRSKAYKIPSYLISDLLTKLIRLPRNWFWATVAAIFST